MFSVLFGAFLYIFIYLGSVQSLKSQPSPTPFFLLLFFSLLRVLLSSWLYISIHTYTHGSDSFLSYPLSSRFVLFLTLFLSLSLTNPLAGISGVLYAGALLYSTLLYSLHPTFHPSNRFPIYASIHPPIENERAVKWWQFETEIARRVYVYDM